MPLERGYEGGRAGTLPTFKIHDVEITGYFEVCFSNNKWCVENIVLEEAVVNKKDFEKLTNALKNNLEVEIECSHDPSDQKTKHMPSERISHGNGKAKIKSLKYDDTRPILKDISFELTEWTQKEL